MINKRNWTFLVLLQFREAKFSCFELHTLNFLPGWCHGYTCQERLSTFNAIVAMDFHYEMYMTSYNPQKTRLKLLNVEEEHAITVEIYYPKPQRLDIYRQSKSTIPYYPYDHANLLASELDDNWSFST